MSDRKPAIKRESDEDRKNEAEIVSAIQAEWMCESQKIPMKYSLDYALTRNNLVVAYVEVKDRPSWKGYDTYMLSAYKFNRALELAKAQNRPCYFAARLGSDIMWTCLSQLPLDVVENTQIGGWASPRDADDIEPVVHIPISYFRTLKGSGGKDLPRIEVAA
tara:strand:+ start:794 stop:1279 length:486 start_codon:yes stop_codon:yes gene_type:complete